jgi:hypothetical protein
MDVMDQLRICDSRWIFGVTCNGGRPARSLAPAGWRRYLGKGEKWAWNAID